jgi:hypothetical protein
VKREFQRAAGYADRILQGEKPDELPYKGRPHTNWS